MFLPLSPRNFSLQIYSWHCSDSVLKWSLLQLFLKTFQALHTIAKYETNYITGKILLIEDLQLMHYLNMNRPAVVFLFRPSKPQLSYLCNS